jgi:hypothetical protein
VKRGVIGMNLPFVAGWIQKQERRASSQSVHTAV